MRLITTLTDQHQAYLLSHYLTRQGIENQLEVVTTTDWGSPDYGVASSRIWIVDEDQVDRALKILEEFQENPTDPRFHTQAHPGIFQPNTSDPPPETPLGPREKQPLGPITFYILVICSFLLMLASFQEPAIKKLPPNIPVQPLLTSPINKTLLYDYPYAYELIDKVIVTYGYEALETPEQLPDEAKKLLQQSQNTPYWKGFYDMLVKHLKSPDTAWDFSAPLFEKEQQGELWRLITPIFLHYDIFHLFFNMIWLIVLGKQMEERLGKWRYIAFILLTGIASNTAQYLMSGSNFVGFSGVLCAMLAFVWIRQKRAPWEGYRLERGTMTFIAAFILLMFGLQILSFFLEISMGTAIPIGIANTAHLVGAFVGYLLARMQQFSWKS